MTTTPFCKKNEKKQKKFLSYVNGCEHFYFHKQDDFKRFMDLNKKEL